LTINTDFPVVPEKLGKLLHNPSKFGPNSSACLTQPANRFMTIERISLKYLAVIGNDSTQPVYAQPVYILEGQGRNKPGLMSIL
jgi:hypothetical protein